MQPGRHIGRLLPQARNRISLSSHRLDLSLRMTKKLQQTICGCWRTLPAAESFLAPFMCWLLPARCRFRGPGPGRRPCWRPWSTTSAGAHTRPAASPARQAGSDKGYEVRGGLAAGEGRRAVQPQGEQAGSAERRMGGERGGHERDQGREPEGGEQPVGCGTARGARDDRQQARRRRGQRGQRPGAARSGFTPAPGRASRGRAGRSWEGTGTGNRRAGSRAGR
jgi:hypothetical protein